MANPPDGPNNSPNNSPNNDDSSSSTDIINQALSAKGVYILYLASLLTGITALVGLVIAYVQQQEAPEWEQSHYQFLIRTFWIGLLYTVIGSILTVVLVGFVILLFAAIWMIVRCIIGLQLALKQQPVPNPQTWWFS